MFTSVMAALSAIAALPELLSQITSSIKALNEAYEKARESNLQKQMEQMRAEVNDVIKKIEHAQTKEERLMLSLKLANAVAH